MYAAPWPGKSLVKIGTDIDLNKEAFPFMSIRSGKVGGFDARGGQGQLYRELSFEINVRARDGLALWEALTVAGKEYDITRWGRKQVCCSGWKKLYRGLGGR